MSYILTDLVGHNTHPAYRCGSRELFVRIPDHGRRQGSYARGDARFQEDLGGIREFQDRIFGAPGVRSFFQSECRASGRFHHLTLDHAEIGRYL